MADSKHAANSTTAIKKFLQITAKYKVGRKEVLHIWNIVPHPKNRGGAPCTSVRCRQLGGDIASIGFLEAEAKHNSWAVESPPLAGSSCDDSGRSSVTTEEAPTVVGGTTATKTEFQEVFESMHMSDPDIAKTLGEPQQCVLWRPFAQPPYSRLSKHSGGHARMRMHRKGAD